MEDQATQYEHRQDYSILFADIKGFSQLKPFQQQLYLKQVLKFIADALYSSNHQPEQANTWGDGLVAFFASHTRAIRCALTLRDIFRVTPWEDMGLPPLKIRISVHAGEVFVGLNPVTKKSELIGTEINRAARIEPVVRPNHVYVTKDFVNRCKTENIKFQLLGDIPLPKGWGSEEIYVASWQHEALDPVHLRSSNLSSDIQDPSVLNYPQSSKFGRRLLVSTHAKLAIGEYCVKTGFWKAEDIVFLESGTLPVFMILALYKRYDPELRPKLLVTNNLGCLAIAMMAEESGGEAYAVYPEDMPMNWILIGGRVLDDYAATIPEDLIGGSDDSFWHSSKLGDYLRAKGINHIVMMISKLTRIDGPCAVSSAMRRFKKLLLQYVAENSDVRMSILGEADKLTSRRGWPCDSVDQEEGIVSTNYWEQVVSSHRATIIVALSPEMTAAQVGLAKRELYELKEAGAMCVLLDESGNTITFESE